MKQIYVALLCIFSITSFLEAQELTPERWIEELEKTRERDLKADRKLLKEGIETLGAKLLEPLEDLLQTTPYGRVVSGSVSHIRSLGKEGHNVIPLLRICMNDYSTRARKQAIQAYKAVFDIGENAKHYKEAYPDLAYIMLYDWSAGCRSVAASTIGSLKAKEFTYILIQGLEDLNEDTKGRVYKVLKKVAKPDKLIFINQLKEWKQWYEDNKNQLPTQMIPEAPKFLNQNPPDVPMDLGSPESVLRSLIACIAKKNMGKMGDLWSKKEDKFSKGQASEKQKKESEWANKIYYARMYPLYERLARRLLDEKPKNTADKKDNATFVLSQTDRLDRVKEIRMVKEYNAIEIYVQTSTGSTAVAKAKKMCQEALDYIELISLGPEDTKRFFLAKAKEHALEGKDQEKNLLKYFVVTEFEPKIKEWFLKAKPMQISPIFPRDRGASCFLYLGEGWRISNYEPSFSE